MFNFGWKLLVSGLIDTIWKQIYQIVIGKVYTVDSLGQYTRARGFTDMLSSNITSVVQRVSYPVLSSIQDDPERLKTGYKKIIKTVMLITFVLTLGLAAVAKPLVLVLIGEKWLQSVEFIQIVAFGSMLYPLHAINLNMLQVKGRSDVFLILEIIKKTIAVIPVVLGIFVGIKAMLWGSVFTGFFAYYLNSYYSGRDLNYSMTEQIKDILPSFIVASVMAVLVWTITLMPISSYTMLPLQITVAAIIVLLIGETTKLEEYLEIKNIALSGINKIKRK